jgi:hypothetical protein
VACKKRHKSCKRNGEGLRQKRKRAEESPEETEVSEVSEVSEVVVGRRKCLRPQPDVFTFRVQAEPRPEDPLGALGRWITRSESRWEEMEKRVERLERKWEKWEAEVEEERRMKRMRGKRPRLSDMRP